VLVWAGEHYVVDTLLGAAYAAAVVLLLRVVRTRAGMPTVEPCPIPSLTG
jgi:hypothetical protein